jgi:hypothetical protein
MLDYETACELLDYDRETGVLLWKVDCGNGTRAGCVAGRISKHGYRTIRIKRRNYQAGRLIWLIMKGRWPEGEIDHINRVHDDNRLKNLRDVSHSTNCRNTAAHDNNPTGVANITLTRPETYVTWAMVNGRKILLGTFRTLNEAVLAQHLAEEQGLAVLPPPRELRSNNTTGHAGVSKAGKKYVARIGKTYLGFFATKRQAVAVRLEAEKHHRAKKLAMLQAKISQRTPRAHL